MWTKDLSLRTSVLEPAIPAKRVQQTTPSLCGKDSRHRICSHDNAHQTRERGWGLRTVTNVKKNDLLIEYRGEIVSHKTCEERMKTIYKDEKNFYFLDYRNGEVIDACSKGTDARFINHSCEPNCRIEKWQVNPAWHYSSLSYNWFQGPQGRTPRWRICLERHPWKHRIVLWLQLYMVWERWKPTTLSLRKQTMPRHHREEAWQARGSLAWSIEVSAFPSQLQNLRIR